MDNHASPAATPPAVNASFRNSEFDAGLNASSAWTEHLERTSTYQAVSDDEKEDKIQGRPARALYDFEGRADFRELCASAVSHLVMATSDLSTGQ
jgi:sorting nexin-9/18/33